jgi:hypothetical protein
VISLRKKRLEEMGAFKYRDYTGIIAIIKRNEEVNMRKTRSIYFFQDPDILVVPVIEHYDQACFGHKVAKSSNKQ